jgi:hypothetical protein
MDKGKEFVLQGVRVALLAGIAAASFSLVSAWTGPTAAAPGNNTAAPINTSATAQTKAGTLTTGGLTSNGGTGIGVYGGSTNNYGLYGHSDTSWGAVITQTGGNLGLVVENNAGTIYSELMQGGWGLVTNQNVNTSGYYYGLNAFGGGFEMTSGGGCYVGNPWTGGCSCPSFAPSAAYTYYMDTNSTYGGGRGYLCY